MAQLLSHSPAETQEIARRLAQRLVAGDVIAFLGGLGMGKTAFTRGLARELGDDSQVSSPTFALVHEYTGCNPKLAHFDMYRVHSLEDLETTGFYDYLDAGWILAVEWSENIAEALPPGAIYVRLAETGAEDERSVTIFGGRLGDESNGIDS